MTRPVVDVLAVIGAATLLANGALLGWVAAVLIADRVRDRRIRREALRGTYAVEAMLRERAR